mmetsp:Transcript_16453/g.30581  ORF Transcript_16453/g.30581 Transcript_16453/m.30581 type:complete len:283 (-) Transcript_16453:143-991(-)
MANATIDENSSDVMLMFDDWRETNYTFGGHTVLRGEKGQGNDSEDDDGFRRLEFEFENLPPIHLRERIHGTAHSSGLALWTCSQILSAYLADHPELVRDKRVLELGAGLGLCGIVAHHLDADEVLVTDGDVDVLHNLKHNVRVNRKEMQLQHQKHKQRHVACSQLVWGRDQDTYNRRPVILATDVFYSPELVDPLWHTVDDLLQQDGVFLLAFCPHNVSIREVLEKAMELGFTWTCPNICCDDESDEIDPESKEEEDDDEEWDYFPPSDEFGYHVFCFRRRQ